LREELIMSAIKIDKKISKYRVEKQPTAEEKLAAAAAAAAEIVRLAPAVEMTHDRQGRSSKVVRMTEEVQRPEMLVGSTYKIKTPVSDHAMYVRGLHQLEEPRSLPVDRGADAHHLRGIPQGRRRHVPGR
jgi:hypothetical protein